MDRHKLWRRVRYDWEQVGKVAPPGHEVVVEVFLVGRPEPIELGYVETRRGDDDPWVRFESSAGIPEDAPDAKAKLTDFWVHVHESYIERVEVRFRRIEKQRAAFGFEHREVDPETIVEAA